MMNIDNSNLKIDLNKIDEMTALKHEIERLQKLAFENYDTDFKNEVIFNLEEKMRQISNELININQKEYGEIQFYCEAIMVINRTLEILKRINN